MSKDINIGPKLTQQQVEEIEQKLVYLRTNSERVEKSYADSVEDGAWHDNPHMEQALVDMSTLDFQMNLLQSQLDNAVTVDMSTGGERVGVGATVGLQPDDENYFSVSIGIKAKGASRISTDTPLAVAIMGKEVGDTTVVPSENPYSVEIMSISWQQQ